MASSLKPATGSLVHVSSRSFISFRRVFLRAVSSSANPFPFPTTAHPTPHQIFHLPQSASRDDVKARYYDLVRIYHPDSPISRAVPPETAHSRFQAISAAYAVLSGKANVQGGATDTGADTPRASDLSTAMWKARQRKRAELDVGVDERWKERALLGAVILTIALARLRERARGGVQKKQTTRSGSSSRTLLLAKIRDTLLALWMSAYGSSAHRAQDLDHKPIP
ncbi:hypothetical protein A0H81_12988 [Grifola frondosa]|uniref:J domain-containing protein n=1 Tax=Grifola frondosa TaxID=5627 RepID=A0A1C7LR36_GRIFR|nr:hypothetical protein A0H81_12988 [Grifola frondosa]